MGKRQHSFAQSAADGIQRDIRFSRHLFIAALLLVVTVVISATINVGLQIAKHIGHIYIPALAVAAPGVRLVCAPSVAL